MLTVEQFRPLSVEIYQFISYRALEKKAQCKAFVFKPVGDAVDKIRLGVSDNGTVFGSCE
ncbi:hypothetical protein Barb7_02142 [Bacteroidales bacterium Barb7]|nr:hypothetical protein Barb7_02142 [Bacteroidales bacterium Barb7]